MNDLDLFAEPWREDEHYGRRQTRRSRRAARRRQRRRRRSGRAALMFSMAFLVAVVGGGGLVGYAALDRYLHPADFAGQGAGDVTVQIKDGDSGRTMGDRLRRAGVVRTSQAFENAHKKEPDANRIQPGFYRMRQHMSSAAALALLLDPKSRADSQITLPEGLRTTQVVAQLSKKTGIPQRDFQKVVARPDGIGLPPYAKGRIEGYLYPGRYDLDPNAGAREILAAMVARYKKVATDTGLEERAARAKTTPDKVITMASLIQAESGRHSDMPRISRVIYNRLRHKPQPMYLKFDSTTLYGLGKFGFVASNEDIKSTSPYNTYQRPGLPPGPISNPGEDAIESVFRPAKGDWLYFVTTDPDRKITKYATNEQDFAKLKAELMKYLRARGNGGGN